MAIAIGVVFGEAPSSYPHKSVESPFDTELLVGTTLPCSGVSSMIGSTDEGVGSVSD